MMRLGILGGTFDPPHIAHLLTAEAAREHLGLEHVLWVPAASPPHKEGLRFAAASHRVQMVRLAIRGHAAFAVSLMDVQRPGPHYTVDMLRLLARAYPGPELFFLAGSDSLRDLVQWREPAGIVSLARFVVMDRPGVTVDLKPLEAQVPGLERSVMFVPAPQIDISSTHIRSRIASGRSIRYMVPAAVEEYIHRHRLYLDSVGPRDDI
jgi:nicotinate-nucleotide adenylyltransferase